MTATCNMQHASCLALVAALAERILPMGMIHLFPGTWIDRRHMGRMVCRRGDRHFAIRHLTGLRRQPDSRYPVDGKREADQEHQTEPQKRFHGRDSSRSVVSGYLIRIGFGLFGTIAPLVLEQMTQDRAQFPGFYRFVQDRHTGAL